MKIYTKGHLEKMTKEELLDFVDLLQAKLWKAGQDIIKLENSILLKEGQLSALSSLYNKLELGKYYIFKEIKILPTSSIEEDKVKIDLLELPDEVKIDEIYTQIQREFFTEFEPIIEEKIRKVNEDHELCPECGRELIPETSKDFRGEHFGTPCYEEIVVALHCDFCGYRLKI